MNPTRLSEKSTRDLFFLTGAGTAEQKAEAGRELMRRTDTSPEAIDAANERQARRRDALKKGGRAALAYPV